MHRAFTHFRLGPTNLVNAVSLFAFFQFVWLRFLPDVCRFWNWVLLLGVRVLPLRAEVAVSHHHLTHLIRFDISYLRMEPVLPSPLVWSLTCAVTLMLFASTFFLSERFIPIKYLLRGLLLVPATALFYFVFLPAAFPHTPDSYMEGLVMAGLALISTVPLLYGLTYYIFDFGLLKKAFLTAITMTHLTLFLPLQILLQALFLQKTVMFMPVLYIIFGMPVDILIIVALYSWGMTWSFRSATSA
jgi:hypothetical protein